MLKNLLEQFYKLSLQQRLLAINLSAFSALGLILLRYTYIYIQHNNISALIFLAIVISGLAIALLLLRFYFILDSFHSGNFIDNRDWLCASLILLGCSGTWLAKHALGESFQTEALALSFMAILQAPHLNRFSPLVAIPVMALTSAIYAWGVGFPNLLFVWAFVFMQQITLWALCLGSLMELRAHARSKNLTSELRSTQTLLEHSTQRNERMRVGRELHDNMGHHLAALNINLQVCEQLATPELKPAIQTCQGSVENLYQQLHETVDGLKNAGECSLVQAVKKLIQNTPRLDIQFDCNEQLHLNEEHSNALLRIIQESITNTLKHSDSNNMCIQLSLDIVAKNKAQIQLYIADYGSQYCDTEKLQLSNGLQGIQERIQALNGQVQFNNPAQKGFSINISLPYELSS